MDDERVWTDMAARLERLTVKQLIELARNEHIPLGTDKCWKSAIIHRIVAERKRRVHDEPPRKHPWRCYGIALEQRRLRR
jgi:hypothetical protein